MKFPWLKRIGLCYLPITVMGWILLVVGVADLVYAFIDIDHRSHSVSDTLMNFSFHLLRVVVAYSAIAFLTSRVPKTSVIR